MAVGNELERCGQDSATGAVQVDLDQADACLPKLALLLDVEVAAGTGELIRRANDLDHCDDAPARLEVDDLDEALPDRFVLFEVNDQWFGHGNSIARPEDGLLARTALDDSDIGYDVSRKPDRRLDKDSLIDPCDQIGRQLLLDRRARAVDHGVMHDRPRIAPDRGPYRGTGCA